MVRTKTQARTLQERYPNVVPQFNLRPALPIQFCNRNFTDHMGKPAIMSWESTSPNLSMPPLPCWVFYIVHPVHPSDFDGCAFYTQLEDDQCFGFGGGQFRYEFFFLPGATAEECHAHYIAEVHCRGTMWDQITKVKTAIEVREQQGGKKEEIGQQPIQEAPPDGNSAGNGQLPGLLLEEADDGFLYRNFFFMYADANLDCSGSDGRTREMYIVRFDPVPLHPDEMGRFDPMDYPFYKKQITARGEDGVGGGLIGWMEETKYAGWHNEAIAATEDALDMGWKSW